MSKFSQTQGLNVSQAQLDFVDVDTATDNPLYLDPYAIQIRDDEWSSACGDHIRSFFNEVLDALLMLMPWEAFAPSIPLIAQATGEGFAELTRRMPELAE